MADKKSVKTKERKAVQNARIPSKTSINLFIEEKHTGKYVVEILIFLVFMCGVAVFSKVCVQGKLDEMNRLESNYHQLENEVEEAKASLADYEDIRSEYSHYGNGYLNSNELALQDRLDMLALVEEKLLNQGALVEISISGNVATLTINSAKLASVSDVAEELEESDIVTYVTVSNAATKEQSQSQAAEDGTSENVVTSMTIYFTSPSGEQSDETEEEDGGSNFLTEAMENVAEGTASDLAQTDVTGGEQ